MVRFAPAARHRFVGADDPITCVAPGGANSPDSLERLGDEIAELAAHLHAATYRLLVRLAEFDRRDGWGRGFRSCAHWLSWRTGIALGAAREKVRVARALERLPLLSEAMRRGELSYAKVRAATRVATPENEARLLELARHGTASHMERVVRAWRRVDRLEEQREEQKRHERRHLSLYIDEDGTYVVRGRLAPEVGALLERALQAASDALRAETRRTRAGCDDAATSAIPDPQPSPRQRRADAIGLVAEWALGGDGAAGKARGSRYHVVVHVDAEALRAGAGSGQSVLENGARVSAETSRRLACDAARSVMTHAPDGTSLDAGRRTRAVPAAIRRALDHRDGGCRFPGCGLGFCDAHHIVHWADGGATRLDNLMLLCRRHHRAVHEDGFRVRLRGSGQVVFERPDGRPLPDVPAAPRLARDPVASLMRVHREQGVAIDAWTPTPDWRGERLDLGLAVLALRG
ncbi:MAG: DUF222 domain-containing protein, partial [Longimicrobiales bacterium]